MDKKTCKLCENEAADKENSHIIPKFLSKGLFENTKPRHSLELKKMEKGEIFKTLLRKTIFYVKAVKRE